MYKVFLLAVCLVACAPAAYAQNETAPVVPPQALPQEPAPAPMEYKIHIDVIIPIPDPEEGDQKFTQVGTLLDSILADCLLKKSPEDALRCTRDDIQADYQLGLFGSNVNFLIPEDVPVPSVPTSAN